MLRPRVEIDPHRPHHRARSLPPARAPPGYIPSEKDKAKIENINVPIDRLGATTTAMLGSGLRGKVDKHGGYAMEEQDAVFAPVTRNPRLDRTLNSTYGVGVTEPHPEPVRFPAIESLDLDHSPLEYAGPDTVYLPEPPSLAYYRNRRLHLEQQTMQRQQEEEGYSAYGENTSGSGSLYGVSLRPASGDAADASAASPRAGATGRGLPRSRSLNDLTRKVGNDAYSSLLEPFGLTGKGQPIDHYQSTYHEYYRDHTQGDNGPDSSAIEGGNAYDGQRDSRINASNAPGAAESEVQYMHQHAPSDTYDQDGHAQYTHTRYYDLSTTANASHDGNVYYSDSHQEYIESSPHRYVETQQQQHPPGTVHPGLLVPVTEPTRYRRYSDTPAPDTVSPHAGVVLGVAPGAGDPMLETAPERRPEDSTIVAWHGGEAVSGVGSGAVEQGEQGVPDVPEEECFETFGHPNRGIGVQYTRPTKQIPVPKGTTPMEVLQELQNVQSSIPRHGDRDKKPAVDDNGMNGTQNQAGARVSTNPTTTTTLHPRHQSTLQQSLTPSLTHSQTQQHPAVRSGIQQVAKSVTLRPNQLAFRTLAPPVLTLQVPHHAAGTDPHASTHTGLSSGAFANTATSTDTATKNLAVSRGHNLFHTLLIEHGSKPGQHFAGVRNAVLSSNATRKAAELGGIVIAPADVSSGSAPPMDSVPSGGGGSVKANQASNDKDPAVRYISETTERFSQGIPPKLSNKKPQLPEKMPSKKVAGGGPLDWYTRTR